MDPEITVKADLTAYADYVRTWGIPVLTGLAFFAVFVSLNLPDAVTSRTSIEATVQDAFLLSGGKMYLTVKLPDGQSIVVHHSARHPPRPGETVTLRRIGYQSGKFRYFQ